MALRSIDSKNLPEFPSDNPGLWELRAPLALVSLLCVTETETASETETEPESESESETGEIEVYVEVVDFDDADFAHAEDGSIPPPAPAPVIADVVPPPPDLFELFVRTLVEVALAAGTPAKVVEVLPGMLGAARLSTQSLDAATLDALVGAGMLARSETGAITRSDAFVATAQAWKATLMGQDADFSACTVMLDEWSAQIVATLAGAPQRQETLRRDLRSRGVAAFGLLVDAA